MNLMFRKNFREQKSSGLGKTGIMKTTTNRHTSKRSNRDQGYTPIEEQYFRTHLFFNLPRTDRSIYNNCNEMEEPKCGPMTGTYPSTQSISVNNELATTDYYPQPLIDRSNNTEGLLRWSSASTPSRQVSFRNSGSGREETSSIKLSQLSRDCFVIPLRSIGRFLPDGVPMPRNSSPSNIINNNYNNNNTNNNNNNNNNNNSQVGGGGGGLNVMEVPDPKLCILCHLMSPMEPVDSVLETPLSQPLIKQRNTAKELINDVVLNKTAITGMLLVNMERNADFPLISYYVINASRTNPGKFYDDLRKSSLEKFDPRKTKYTSAHTLDLYSEVAAICRPPINEPGTPLTRINTNTTGYIVSVYKVFEGDDREIFERNWLYWTGARMIYRYLPQSAGLKKIVLHKSVSQKGDKMYFLLCECTNLLSDLTVCAKLLPALRARLTGYTGLYRPIQTF